MIIYNEHYILVKWSIDINKKRPINNTFEYSVLKNIDPHPLIKQFGTSFKQDDISIKILGKNNPKAVRIMDELKWY